ncbi:unnamed protein product [Hydatigera taeniaeformis]|uniref:Uncharacterized protein n=1 Tax=Hydatigena taeniaeformis TaxID=6205 RepID=A0A0R3XDL6_HYDTA|nr:unnamed protein product [Hydatigera taeniaeformis]
MSTSEDAWLWETPEDVDVAVAVRDFAKAARLIARSRRRLAQLLPSDASSEHQQPQQTQVSAAAIGLTKLRDRVEARAANLCTVLQEELTRAADRHTPNQLISGIEMEVCATLERLRLSNSFHSVLSYHFLNREFIISVPQRRGEENTTSFGSIFNANQAELCSSTLLGRTVLSPFDL